jgi:hypothetical protein
VLLLGTVTRHADHVGILVWLDRMRDTVMDRADGLMILAGRIEALTKSLLSD